jgi:hypothetical protein
MKVQHCGGCCSPAFQGIPASLASAIMPQLPLHSMQHYAYLLDNASQPN